MALLVAGAFFMEIVDATIITPAIPLVAASFGVEPVDVNIAISAYLVTLAVLIPASGWLADRFGPRPVFTAAIAIFTLASLGCALSTSLPMLVGTRILQGVGGAMMVPVGRLAVLRFSGKANLMRAIALLTWPALTAPVVAPVLGGAIASLGSWRWIFLVNVPIGVVGVLLSRRLIRGEAHPSPRPLDWRGLLMLGAGIAAALIALENVHVDATHGALVAAGGATAVVLLAAATWHLMHASDPLVELRVLRVPTLRITVTAGSLYRLVITAVPFLLALEFQLVFGWTPFASGLMVAVLFLGNIAVKPATTPLMRRFGIRRVLLVNGVASVGWYGLLAGLAPSMPVAAVAAILFVSGALRSIGFTAYVSLAFSDLSGDDLTHGNTLNAAVQELAAGLGIALAALVLTTVGPFARTAGAAYSWTFVALGALMAITIVATIRLPRDAGSAVTAR
ncbi:MFS transporter [Mycobacterium yunnanensis]|uniref:MFS transporter n=1 Tax=Mycobacterium yunnanensis TaxID=368477 RepID=A0A9X2YHI8_9MYCO|nr:MFS transporter [Mycobacterium yunnanensis]MCV7419503.1 MFS transporter [Mycobacterium yunnanensis]